MVGMRGHLGGGHMEGVDFKQVIELGNQFCLLFSVDYIPYYFLIWATVIPEL